jgi:hypothetical protein
VSTARPLRTRRSRAGCTQMKNARHRRRNTVKRTR